MRANDLAAAPLCSVNPVTAGPMHLPHAEWAGFAATGLIAGATVAAATPDAAMPSFDSFLPLDEAPAKEISNGSVAAAARVGVMVCADEVALSEEFFAGNDRPEGRRTRNVDASSASALSSMDVPPQLPLVLPTTAVGAEQSDGVHTPAPGTVSTAASRSPSLSAPVIRSGDVGTQDADGRPAPVERAPAEVSPPAIHPTDEPAQTMEAELVVCGGQHASRSLEEATSCACRSDFAAMESRATTAPSPAAEPAPAVGVATSRSHLIRDTGIALASGSAGKPMAELHAVASADARENVQGRITVGIDGGQVVPLGPDGVREFGPPDVIVTSARQIAGSGRCEGPTLESQADPIEPTDAPALPSAARAAAHSTRADEADARIDVPDTSVEPRANVTSRGQGGAVRENGGDRMDGAEERAFRRASPARVAELPAESTGGTEGEKRREDSSVLIPLKRPVSARLTFTGTDAAQPNAVKSDAFNAPADALRVFPPAPAVNDGAGAAAPIADVRLANPTAALHAVESVWAVVEHAAAREQNAVKLEFDIAGEWLCVRIERTADEVRATFETDSAELRTTLAHEWQAMAAERPARVVETIFTPTTPASSSANADARGSFGQSGAQDRDSAHRHSGAGSSRVSEPRSSATAVIPVHRAAERHGKSRHLHAIA